MVRGTWGKSQERSEGGLKGNDRPATDEHKSEHSTELANYGGAAPWATFEHDVCDSSPLEVETESLWWLSHHHPSVHRDLFATYTRLLVFFCRSFNRTTTQPSASNEKNGGGGRGGSVARRFVNPVVSDA